MADLLRPDPCCILPAGGSRPPSGARARAVEGDATAFHRPERSLSGPQVVLRSVAMLSVAILQADRDQHQGGAAMQQSQQGGFTGRRGGHGADDQQCCDAGVIARWRVPWPPSDPVGNPSRPWPGRGMDRGSRGDGGVAMQLWRCRRGKEVMAMQWPDEGQPLQGFLCESWLRSHHDKSCWLIGFEALA